MRDQDRPRLVEAVDLAAMLTLERAPEHLLGPRVRAIYLVP